MQRVDHPGTGGRFDPDKAVTAREVHRSLVLVLGMGRRRPPSTELATTDGYVFDTPPIFGVNLLAMRLGLRFNNKVDESQDVTPRTRLRRKQVAWSLYRATTLDDWVVPYLVDQYAGMVLPKMGASRRSIVDWGVRYVGYPYIWAGEWGFNSPSPAAFGGQPGPGFDCSGLSWWALRRDDGVYWEISPPRPYQGWPLPQRSSAEMSRVTKNRLTYVDLRPGDLMFYDGDGDGTVDHVDVYVGNGWSLDSSSSVGGVTLMWVETGWYRQHFVHGRRILPIPKPTLGRLLRRRRSPLQDRLLLVRQRAASTGLGVSRHDHGLGFRRQPPVRAITRSAVRTLEVPNPVTRHSTTTSRSFWLSSLR